MTKKNRINLDFRPEIYFGPVDFEKFLIDQVKGDVIKKQLGELYKAGRFEELKAQLELLGHDGETVKSLGAIHPMYMGGNYLPDTEANEVEIARIVIQSTTFDVTCVYAQFVGGEIHYRVVDEYDGDTLSGPSSMTSKEPLKLRELTEFFLSAWDLLEILEMNFSDDLDSALGFFTGSSDFYRDFHDVIEKEMADAFQASDARHNHCRNLAVLYAFL